MVLVNQGFRKCQKYYKYGIIVKTQNRQKRYKKRKMNYQFQTIIGKKFRTKY